MINEIKGDNFGQLSQHNDENDEENSIKSDLNNENKLRVEGEKIEVMKESQNQKEEGQSISDDKDDADEDDQDEEENEDELKEQEKDEDEEEKEEDEEKEDQKRMSILSNQQLDEKIESEQSQDYLKKDNKRVIFRDKSFSSISKVSSLKKIEENGETNSEKEIRLQKEEEELKEAYEKSESEKVATFYGREGDRFQLKIYIYFVVHLFDVILKLVACYQFVQNEMGSYMVAQLMFILLERIAKIGLFSTLNIYKLIFFNLLFLDYFAIYQYQELRKTIRNYNLYNVIIQRIDILMASKLIEATLLAGPSLLITLYASINGLGDRFNTPYILSVISTLATLILANLEILDLQLVQCKFNSLTNEMRIKFEQNYVNLLRDLVIVLINIAAQAGFWMLCSQLIGFILAHAFISYFYILGVTSTVAYFSLTRENMKVLQEKTTVNIRSLSISLSLIIGLFLFVIIYSMFFFVRTKKRLFEFLLDNTLSQNNQLFSDIAMIHLHYKDDPFMFSLDKKETRGKSNTIAADKSLGNTIAIAVNKSEKLIGILGNVGNSEIFEEQQPIPSQQNEAIDAILEEEELKKRNQTNTKLIEKQFNQDTFQKKKRTTYSDFMLPKKGFLPHVPDSVVFSDYKFYHFSLAVKGITAFRVYCIINIIGLIITDALLNKPDNYIAIRIISYCCSIIVLFHLFQLRRDFFLFLLIKQERTQQIYLQKLLRKVQLPFSKMIKLREQYPKLQPIQNIKTEQIEQMGKPQSNLQSQASSPFLNKKIRFNFNSKS